MVVILSGVNDSQRESFTESKDPYPYFFFGVLFLAAAFLPAVFFFAGFVELPV